ncbi:hypothetical protein BSNK01_15110 [Bacillaceae bacterium]
MKAEEAIVKIAIVGAGAIGLLLAHRLADSLQGELCLVTRTARQAETIQREGVEVIERDGKQTGKRVLAFPFFALSGSFDLCVLAVKQTQLVTAARGILPFLAPDAPLICLQNGIGHVERLAELVAKERIYPAVTTQGAYKCSSRLVRHTGDGKTWIGGFREKPDRRVADLLARLARTRFPFTWDEGIEARIWRKLAVNCVINPLTALFGCRNGELLASQQALFLMRRIFREVQAVARKEGYELGDDLWQEIVAVCRNTSSNKSSMLQDIESCRPTEIDALNGALVRLADRHRLSLAYNDKLYALVTLFASLRQR